MVIDFSKQQSVISVYMAEMRDITLQKDPMRFRRNLERIGTHIGFEISRKLEYERRDITTPLGIAQADVLKEQPVIATILRAGLPLHNGLLQVFDFAENGFISAYRKHHKDGSFEVFVDYMACPLLDDKVLILCDPMLATGTSMVMTYQALLRRGRPKHVHIVSAIASVAGVEYTKRNMPENVTIWTGAIDEELTAQSYIVPGLGDAGDLAYGAKV